ncbi:MAG: hypothetical protein COA79_17225 [Planctomycetota bacterium]|nr:MAG: hypothetical protein COA79_17225 [Planctomycetota bacterium]
MKTNIILGIIILLLTCYVLLLHVDHRTLIKSHNNLGRDSTYHTYAFQSLNALGRPEWGHERLKGQWIPLLNKRELVVKANGQVIINTAPVSSKAIMKSIYFDFQEINSVRVALNILSGLEGKGIVLELIYMMKDGTNHVLKNFSSDVLQDMNKRKVFDLGAKDMIWGYFQIKLLNQKRREGEVILEGIPEISF